MNKQTGLTEKLIGLICISLFMIILSGCGGGGGGGNAAPQTNNAPSITTPPTSQTVMEGQTATFTVVATGTTPLTYQWKKDGVDISGATAASFTTQATALSDSGAKFRVIVTNAISSTTSTDAILTVVTTEVFAEADRPGLEHNTAGDYFLVKPWNYGKDYNASRKYPLLIYLHGSSQAGYLKNLYYMGMGYYDSPDFANEYQKAIADVFRKTYPCFMYVPQQSGSSWDRAKLITQIEQLKTDYRIDTNRIYLHGFSMGGYGAYYLANDYYDYNGQLFAGIILLAGCGTSNFKDQVVAKTSMWLQIGLQDSYTNTRSAYTFLKSHALNSSATETSSSYTIIGILGAATDSHLANTVTLTKNGIEIVKKTEYPNDGHFITAFPFADTSVMSWLFSQSLLNR